MNSRYQVLLLFLGVLSISGCDPDPAVVPDTGVDYFPLEVGRTLEYRVDSIIFDDDGTTNKLDTFSSFVLEQIIERKLDNEGDTIFIIQRSHRNDTNDVWHVTDIWTSAVKDDFAERHEENQRIIKLGFPLYPDRSWDPVRYINPSVSVTVGTEDIELFQYWEGTVKSIDQQEVVGEIQFNEVLTCLQADEDTEIERRFVLEKYAKNIGLISRTDTILDSRCKRLGDFTPCLGMPWIEKGEKGYIMEQVLISYQ